MRPDLIQQLLPPVAFGTAHWESTYPARELVPGAMVTRFAPSPTGFVHIGGVYVAMISRSVAHASGGVYFVRIEDTDQQREVEGALAQFERAFAYLDVASDESPQQIPWGPYNQAARAEIYLSYVAELLEAGKAYPCFCTREELAEAAERQREAKVSSGYYGEWARCRDLHESEVEERLAEGRSSVIRFRSTALDGTRVAYDDAIRGRIEQLDNVNDVVILKSGEGANRLPTYHFAHAVDDHLMRVNLVVRGDEWISSVPLHLQLFEALGFEPPTYAHIAPLMKMEGSSRRKLSKRKDPEASVDFYIGGGYPAPAVLHYLRGLANARLADLPFGEADLTPIALDACGLAGPLVDLDKLDDISRDFIADLPSDTIREAVVEWAATHDPELATAISHEPALALRALGVGRDNVDNKRKDLGKWSDFRSSYGFYFTDLFAPVADPDDERFGTVPPDKVVSIAADLIEHYEHLDDQPTWFAQIRAVAERQGFAATPKEFKADPDRYVGALRDAAGVVRVLLTGSTNSPDLHQVALVLGEDELKRRIGAVVS